MATTLQVSGTFDVPYEKKPGNVKRVEKENGKAFWSSSGAKAYSHKHGCYVFAIRAGKGYVPHYVGKAGHGFERECFGSHKLVKYNKVLSEGKHGRPVLFFVAPAGTKRVVPARVLAQVEKFLIGLAAERNPDLQNKQHVRAPSWGITGVVRGGGGKRSSAAALFKSLMGL